MPIDDNDANSNKSRYEISSSETNTSSIKNLVTLNPNPISLINQNSANSVTSNTNPPFSNHFLSNQNTLIALNKQLSQQGYQPSYSSLFAPIGNDGTNAATSLQQPQGTQPHNINIILNNQQPNSSQNIPPVSNPTPVQSNVNTSTIATHLIHKQTIENSTTGKETTGGTSIQDVNIVKFKATLIFKHDLPRPKWESKSTIMAHITKNFRFTGKKFAGPISVYLKNNREIVVRGERESDFLLFESSKSSWASTVFDKIGIQACDIERMYDDNSDNMLIGSSHDRLSPEGEKWLKRESRINKIRYRGGNKWDLRFENLDSKEEAKKRGYVQGGGIIFKVSEWNKQVNTSLCDKCAKWGHQIKECVAKKIICKYCAAVDVHSSDKCDYINIPEEHRCHNCKEIGHHAGERMECLVFINYYINICQREKVVVEEKYMKAKTSLEKKKTRTEDSIKLQLDQQLDIINAKLAGQISLNKEMIANEQIDIANYTVCCEQHIDSDVMAIYKKNKVSKRD